MQIMSNMMFMFQIPRRREECVSGWTRLHIGQLQMRQMTQTKGQIETTHTNQTAVEVTTNQVPKQCRYISRPFKIGMVHMTWEEETD